MNDQELINTDRDEFERLLKEFNELDLILFDQTISSLKQEVAVAKNRFLQLPVFNFDSRENIPLTKSLVEYYFQLFLFPDEDVYQKFESMGVARKNLNWFLSLQQLIEEVEKINSSGQILVKRSALLKAIRLYYICQITVDVFIWADRFEFDRYHLKKIELVGEIEKFYRRKTPDRVRNKREEFLSTVINQFTELENNLGLKKKSLFKLVKGQTPRFFLTDSVMKCFINRGENPDSDSFLSTLYPLFSLIFKGQLPTVYEIESSGRYSGKSIQGWQAHVMRIFIYKNSSKQSVTF